MINHPSTLFRVMAAALTLAVLGACQQVLAEPGTAADAAPAVAAVEPAAGTGGDSTADSSLTETERLNAWFDERYEELLQRSPTQMTMLGRKDRYGEIDQFGEAARREEAEWRVASVAEMRERFDYDALTPEAQESWNLWVFQAEEAERNLQWLYHDYLFSELRGPEDMLATFMINFHKVDTEADLRAYISRLREAARALNQLREQGEQSSAKGIRPPRFAFEVARKRATQVVTGGPFSGEADSPLYADVKRKLAKLVETGEIDEATSEALLVEAEEAMAEAFEPAYAAYVAWLDEQIPLADAEARGVSALPDGTDYYNHRLATYTTLPLTADQIHQLGLREVARIKGEMEEIRKQVGFEGELTEFFAFIREDPRFYYPNTDEGREGYLDDTRAYLAEIEQKLPQWFGRLPRMGLEVRRVEAFREVDGGAQHYMPGTPDGSRKGVYYVHMSDMSAYSKTDMETTAYHEASPGHHMQSAIALELEDIPQFRTQYWTSAYGEGWALYAEKLAKEMGQFEDPYMDFGRLTAEMWRAIRLVVDTGLHAKGWSQEQAVQYFLDNSAVPEGAVRSEVRRYLTFPGQATSYKIGMLKIEELRRKSEAALGEAFDIRAFHDVVLGGGALPLPLLEQRVENWLNEQGGQLAAN